MSGIYFHIPYCRQKCSYCNFYYRISQKDKQELLEALNKEIDIRQDYLNNQIVDTIYFGGGTPSILPANEIYKLLYKVKQKFDVAFDAEITLECNPDDLSDIQLKQLKEIGINRLSIGVQSFHDHELKLLNRVHSAATAITSIEQAKAIGFENITIDLIYGLPNQSIKDWEKNIDLFLELKIPHLSAYCLTIEDKTLLHHQTKNNILPTTKEDMAIAHFLLLQNKLKQSGFVQYEISNYAQEGFYSKHNTKYWKGDAYLGIGPSAHSYNGISRQWNIDSNKKYIEHLQHGDRFFEIEKLSSAQQYNEYVFTALRTIWGIDMNFVKNKFCKKIYENMLKNAKKWQNTEDLVIKCDCLCLTEKGKLLADAISADLFEV